MQSKWEPIKDIIKYKNSNIVCKDGSDRTSDFTKMRSYCYYQGNCMSLGLESLFVTLGTSDVFEIVKSQYLQ